MNARKTFHVSLSVADLSSAVEQYRALLGIEPAKLHKDYAKFELADPPVILSLNLGEAPGRVTHLGIRHGEASEVLAELRRIRAQGLELREQKDTTCCYARSTKFWVQDADGLPWEIYHVLEDTPIHSLPEPSDCCGSEAIMDAK